MPRVKRGSRGRKRRAAVLKEAKGYRGARHRLIRSAMEAVDKALAYAYVGRKLRKRDFRALWQTRIAAAAKAHGTSYSALMGALKRKDSQLNRKVLSEVALHHPADFQAIVEWTQTA